ncbi:MAG: HEXXH motif-containing putative peptide modification protein [Myxococcota bacterium]|nr:HEXXH motif-containing putative peptide modification protein [Myxococcota bacterium]
MLPSSFLLLPKHGSTPFTGIHRKAILLLFRHFLHDPFSEISPKTQQGLQRLKPLLTLLAKKNSSALIGALGHIDVSTNLRSAILRLRAPEPLLQKAIPILLAQLPPSNEFFLWDIPTDAPPFGNIEALTYGPAGIEIKKEGSILSWHRPKMPHVLFENGPHLSLFDSNPLAQEEAHPDKDGNQISLGGKEITAWMFSLREACHLIERSLPSWFHEFPRVLQRIVPVGFEPQKHLSASYQNAIGLAYLTLHPEATKMAEAIIHETQHNKLNALFWLDPVLKNGESEWTSSPVRPDLRPLKGVLLAAHAFIPVAAFYRALLPSHPRLKSPLEHIMQQNEESLATLHQKGEPTAIGQRLLSEMQELHNALKKNLFSSSSH